MVLDQTREHASRWVAVVSIAEKIGRTAQTLNEGVKKSEVDSGTRAGVPTDVADKLKALDDFILNFGETIKVESEALAYFIGIDAEILAQVIG